MVGPQEGTKPRDVYVRPIGASIIRPRVASQTNCGLFARCGSPGWRAGSARWASPPPSRPPPRGRAAVAPATQACITRAVAAIQKRYEAVRDLSADFVQTTRAVALGAAGASTTSRGSVVFAKPARCAAVPGPSRAWSVSDGQWLWIYDPAHQEVQKLPVGGDSSREPRSSSCSARARSSAISR